MPLFCHMASGSIFVKTAVGVQVLYYQYARQVCRNYLPSLPELQLWGVMYETISGQIRYTFCTGIRHTISMQPAYPREIMKRSMGR